MKTGNINKIGGRLLALVMAAVLTIPNIPALNRLGLGTITAQAIDGWVAFKENGEYISNLFMKPGDTATVQAGLYTGDWDDEGGPGEGNLEDGETLIWKSSDESIATVSGSGLSATITAVSYGDTTIKAYSSVYGENDGSTLSVSVYHPKFMLQINPGRGTLTGIGEPWKQYENAVYHTPMYMIESDEEPLITIPTQEPEPPTGHSFDGWYLNGNKYTESTIKLDRDMMLMAKYSWIDYPLHYDYAGGTVAEDNPATYHILEESMKQSELEKWILHAPTKEGSSFAGWFVGDSADAYTKAVAALKDGESLTLIAPDKSVIGLGEIGERWVTAVWRDKGEEPEEPVPAISLTISPKDPAPTVEEGGTFTLSAVFGPEGQNENPAVTWSSDNEAVATVSGGVVTGVAAGEATITATATNSGGTQISDSVKVTVTDKIIPVSSVTLDATAVTVEKDKSVTLTPTVIPENATSREVTWASGNETIATVADGVVTGVNPGITSVTAVAGDKVAAAIVTVVDPSAAGGSGASGTEAQPDLTNLINDSGQGENLGKIIEEVIVTDEKTGETKTQIWVGVSMHPIHLQAHRSNRRYMYTMA